MKLSDIFKTKPKGEPMQVILTSTDADYAVALDVRRILAKSTPAPITVQACEAFGPKGKPKVKTRPGIVDVISVYQNGTAYGEIYLGIK